MGQVKEERRGEKKFYWLLLLLSLCYFRFSLLPLSVLDEIAIALTYRGTHTCVRIADFNPAGLFLSYFLSYFFSLSFPSNFSIFFSLKWEKLSLLPLPYHGNRKTREKRRDGRKGNKISCKRANWVDGKIQSIQKYWDSWKKKMNQPSIQVSRGFNAN